MVEAWEQLRRMDEYLAVAEGNPNYGLNPEPHQPHHDQGAAELQNNPQPSPPPPQPYPHLHYLYPDIINPPPI
jgi:hypothetical protein